MIKVLLTILLIASNNSFAQTPKILRQSLLTVFQKTIVKDKKGGIIVGRRAWYTCNDSDFYSKNDTISLVSYPISHNNVDCCNTISWTFYEKDKFLETKFQKCKEPATASSAKAGDYYSLKITISGTTTFLRVDNNQGKSYRFEVLDLIQSLDESSERPSYELLLKRIS